MQERGYDENNTNYERNDTMNTKKTIGIITGKHTLPIGIEASDFDNERYTGQQLRIAEDGEVVLVFKSKSLTPAPWLVQKGMSNVFFATYKQAMDYCDMRGYVVKRGKRR